MLILDELEIYRERIAFLLSLEEDPLRRDFLVDLFEEVDSLLEEST